MMTNAPGANAYPITATTFILMPKQPKDKAKSDAALTLLQICAREGSGRRRKSSTMSRCRTSSCSRSRPTSAPASSEPSPSSGAEERRRR